MTDATYFLDGTETSAGDARISVLDHGLLYGDGVFEGIRIAHGRVFRLDDHIARLERGARALGIALPGGPSAARETILAAARRHGRDAAYVRFIVTRGEGPLGVDPTLCDTPRTICIVASIGLHDPAARARGLSLVTSGWRRPPHDVLDPQIKSLNYLNNVMAKAEARRAGADEALLLNTRGHVAEAAVANVFAVYGEHLRTPPPSDGALPGITRRTILERAASVGFVPEERTMSRSDLLAADEVCLTGSGAGLISVASLDGVRIGAAEARPAALALGEALEAARRELGVPF